MPEPIETPHDDLANTEEPGLFDTYSLVYAYALVFLVVALGFLVKLPFRQYTAAYVSLATVPFVLGIAATFLTDSSDGLRRAFLRIAVLTPLVLLTGVGIMFGGSLALVGVSGWIRPENFGWLTWISAAVLALVASPLLVALATRLRRPTRIAEVVQFLALGAATALVLVTLGLTLGPEGALPAVARKDAMIYAIGAMTWYLPSFGLATGFWRKTGLV
ncbi:MAG: hypothetical protein HY876_05325 [Coriobacteriales bacterium]|nr:hypothetical protein [Coriobacteriales bacterium]